MKGIPENEGTAPPLSEDQSSQQSVSIIAIIATNYQIYFRNCHNLHSHQFIYYILCRTGCEQYGHYGYDLKSYDGYCYGLYYHSGYNSRR